LEVEAVSEASLQIVMRLKADANAGTGRPDQVLLALGWGDAPAQIHRRKLGFKDSRFASAHLV
jgi:hypothetical protein